MSSLCSGAKFVFDRSLTTIHDDYALLIQTEHVKVGPPEHWPHRAFPTRGLNGI